MNLVHQQQQQKAVARLEDLASLTSEMIEEMHEEI